MGAAVDTKPLLTQIPKNATKIGPSETITGAQLHEKLTGERRTEDTDLISLLIL